MKLNRTAKIEIVLAVLAVLSALILIAGYPVYSYILVISSTLLVGIWFIKSINSSQFGLIPWYAFIFILPMLIVPIGISLKLSIIEGGAFVLFIGISLSLIAIAALFILVLTGKKYLTYLKNVSIRLVPVVVLGIIVYFTPQMHIIEMVYSSDPARIDFLKAKLSNPYSGKEKKQSIAFVSNRNGNSDIYEIRTDGSNLKPLLSGNSNQWSPRATRDGNYLYFMDDADSSQSIRRYNLKNGKIEFIKEVYFDDFYFQLHPEENKIVAHDTISGFYQLFIYDFENDSILQISFDSSNNKKPVFMNDGFRIIFQSNRNGNEDLYLLNLKNDSLTNLTKSEWNERNPSVSPFDDVIVFHSDQDSLDYINLYYLDLNSGERGQLTNSPGMELIAAFSPDAKDLVFGSNRDDNWEIYLMSNRGQFKDRLTNHPAFDGDAIYINRTYLKK